MRYFSLLRRITSLRKNAVPAAAGAMSGNLAARGKAPPWVGETFRHSSQIFQKAEAKETKGSMIKTDGVLLSVRKQANLSTNVPRPSPSLSSLGHTPRLLYRYPCRCVFMTANSCKTPLFASFRGIVNHPLRSYQEAEKMREAGGQVLRARGTPKV